MYEKGGCENSRCNRDGITAHFRIVTERGCLLTRASFQQGGERARLFLFIPYILCLSYRNQFDRIVRTYICICIYTVS